MYVRKIWSAIGLRRNMGKGEVPSLTLTLRWSTYRLLDHGLKGDYLVELITDYCGMNPLYSFFGRFPHSSYIIGVSFRHI